MSSEQDQSSNTSSAEVGPRSLIVSNVLLNADLQSIHEDLDQNYAGLEQITRMYANDGQALAAIRVDFDSEEVVAEILAENAIYIRNRSHRVRAYWPRVCRRCQNEGHFAAECPQNFSNARYLRELVDEQNT